MTEYFDSAYARLLSACERESLGKIADAFEEVDRRVVSVVSICTEFPGFPEDLRERANEVILKYSGACQPVGAKGPCYESPGQHFEGLSSLISELHTIFHELAERRLRGFSDDPRIPTRILETRAEERREQILEARRPPEDFTGERK